MTNLTPLHTSTLRRLNIGTPLVQSFGEGAPSMWDDKWEATGVALETTDALLAAGYIEPGIIKLARGGLIPMPFGTFEITEEGRKVVEEKMIR